MVYRLGVKFQHFPLTLLVVLTTLTLPCERDIVHVDCCGLSTIVIKKIIIIIIIIIILLYFE